MNHRPLGYEPNELPGCSTPQIKINRAFSTGQMRGQGGKGAQLELPLAEFVSFRHPRTILGSTIKAILKKCRLEVRCTSLADVKIRKVLLEVRDLGRVVEIYVRLVRMFDGIVLVVGFRRIERFQRDHLGCN